MKKGPIWTQIDHASFELRPCARGRPHRRGWGVAGEPSARLDRRIAVAREQHGYVTRGHLLEAGIGAVAINYLKHLLRCEADPGGHDNSSTAGLLTPVLCRCTVTAALVAGALAAGGCGGAAASRRAAGHTGPATVAAPSPKAKAKPPLRVKAAPAPVKPYARLLPIAWRAHATSGLVPVARWKNQTAAWIARTSSGVTLLGFNQRLVELHLHSGTIDAGTSGWRYGPAVTGSERTRILAGFNGGFRLNVGAGGFESYGRVAVPLRSGLGSIVTYSDGTTNIGSWRGAVPAPGKRVVSVRQNLTLLIDHRRSAPTLNCVSCWGATLNGTVDPARSALGITAGGRLIWAGAEHPTLASLAEALLAAHVVRAVELDINPEWVAAYLYRHPSARRPPGPVPMVPGQQGIPGEFLSPWSRDFFTIVTR